MFNLFGTSNMGQVGNYLVNDTMNKGGIGTLFQYMNDKYGDGNNTDMKGKFIQPVDDAGMKKIEQNIGNFKPIVGQQIGAPQMLQSISQFNNEALKNGQPQQQGQEQQGIDPKMLSTIASILI